MRAALDGTMQKTLIPSLGNVQGLTIDYGEDRLYWANMQFIESSDLEGKPNHDK